LGLRMSYQRNSCSIGSSTMIDDVEIATVAGRINLLSFVTTIVR
jgi:hypothetical protein